MPRKQERLYKILVIGELATGKTSIVRRYVHGIFSQHYRATIGVDFALKVLHWDADTVIRLQLWDIAGQERFGHMTRVYYKEAQGAIIVYDQTRAATFEAVMKWKNDLDAKVELADHSAIPCVLLGNKCDAPRDSSLPTSAALESFARENNFTAWYEVSARDAINIEEALKSLIARILQNDERLQTVEPDEDLADISSNAAPRSSRPIVLTAAEREAENQEDRSRSSEQRRSQRRNNNNCCLR